MTILRPNRIMVNYIFSFIIIIIITPANESFFFFFRAPDIVITDRLTKSKLILDLDNGAERMHFDVYFRC